MYMLCRNRVADFAEWKEVFDSHLAAHREAMLTLTHMWRAVDDPNNIFFLFEVGDKARAEAFISDPAAAEAGKFSGVIEGEIHFVESVAN